MSHDDDPLLASVDPSELPDLTESMRLVGRAQQGDREALDDLLARYEDRLRRIVRVRLSARLRRCVESVDIVQDTFRSAIGRLADLELRSTASILQWLARIAENEMIDVYRRHYGKKRDRTRERPFEAPPAPDGRRTPVFEPAADSLDPSERAARDELCQLVDDAVSQLPDDYREVVLLRTYYGGSWDFVAREMGKPSEDAARQLHRRARLRLARMLADKLPDET